MPIYIYRCADCGVEFEKRQHFTDEPLTRCPECGHKTLHKVYTPVGVIYKGSGFYSTDHKSSARTASMRAAKAEEKKSDPTAPASTTPAATTPAPAPAAETAKPAKPIPAAE